MANQKVAEAKSEKQRRLEAKEETMEDLVEQMAQLIIEQNKVIIGEDVAEVAKAKVNDETIKRRGRPKKQIEKGGTKDEQEERTTNRSRTTKTA